LNETVILAAARGLYYAATMLLFGDLAFSMLLRAKLPVIVSPTNMMMRWSALTVALTAACVWLVMAAIQMAAAFDTRAVIQTATATLFGQLFLVRMMALMALALALAFAAKRGTKPAMLLAGIALILPAATSHAAASSPAGFAIFGATLDALHLATAGFWIGGLAVLAHLFRRKEANILLALSLFSDWAMIAVLLLVMAGLINGASILLGGSNEGSGGTPSTLYLAVLGTKLALVSAMLTLAATNRFRLMPRGRDAAIARNAALELALGVIVVLLAGALGQLQPTL
jgi:putative copper export protein